MAGAASADNWPQWRGPDYDGISKETKLPAEWGPDKNIVWKLPMPGLGSSTPAIWGDRIFLTSEDAGAQDLLCISTAGKQLWKRQIGNGNKMARDEGNYSSASPSTDGKYVWAFVGTGELACFDFEGKEIWKFNLQDRYGKFNIQFGMHSTPLLYQDRLYLQILYTGGAWVVALDKNTGKEVWKINRKSDGTDENEHSYASPVLWHKDKDAYLITHGGDYAIAHRLEDGSEIWRCADLNPRDHYNKTLRFVASPVATPDLIVVPSAKKGPVVGVKPDAKGLIKTGSPGEQWRMPKGTPDVPCPLVYDGLVYLCGEDGQITCLDAKTGEAKYAQVRIANMKYRGSPVYADGKIYMSGRDGTFTVIKPGPKFEVLAVNKLPDIFNASPAISGGRIYLRGKDALYAVGLTEGK
jgi:outer membrane protein assembly factor BamB